MSSDWHWVNLPGGHVEEIIADLCDVPRRGDWPADLEAGAGPGRGCLVVQTNATAAFHVSFSSVPTPSRGSDEPVLRFVVGKRRNSMTSVGLGNPYIKKEPIDFTKSPDALLTPDPEKSRTYWFLYDRDVGVAAMGTQVAPQADLCRLVCRFRDAVGFRAEACENLRYVSVSAGRQPVSLRILGAGAPPDVSIPRFRFDAAAWRPLPWQGASVVFEPDAVRRQLFERAQQLIARSPIAPFYGLVDPGRICLNPYRLLDPHRRGELLPPGEDGESLAWQDCYDELHRRLEPAVLRSAPWTYWPLRFERADCTSVTLAPVGVGCAEAIGEWATAVQRASGLRNGAVKRELLTLTFSFEVFPVEGETAAQVRRDLVREITAIFEADWGIMEFRAPFLASWQTHTDYTRHEAPPAEPLAAHALAPAAPAF